MERRIYRVWINSSIFLLSLIATTGLTQAQAQIISDTTLPNNSEVQLNGNVTNINGGTIAGKNLFHSFLEFSINGGNTAYFTNTSDIQNIISRVTGSSISNIDGIIKADGIANLFLINPNGIIFGRRGSLQIGGSFVASTANSIDFFDRTQFSATAPQTKPLLSISVPIGLQFESNTRSSNSSNITNTQAFNLRVQSGKTLALIGGNINLNQAILGAQDGRIELGGLAGSGTVGLNIESNDLRLDFPNNVTRADIKTVNTFINVAGTGEGIIAINARNLDISQRSNFNAGIRSNARGSGNRVGNILLNATENLTIVNSNILNQLNSTALSGSSGDIIIKADSLSLDNTRVSTNISGKGESSGNVVIEAQNRVALTNQSRISTNSLGLGNAGDIWIKTGSLSISNNSGLSTSTIGKGNAGGNIYLQAKGLIELANSFIFSVAEPGVDSSITGNAGNINIQAASLTLNDQARLSTSTSAQGGNAGDVTINTQDGVSLANSAIFSDTTGQGNGGNIDVKTKSLTLTDGARVSASTAGAGDAGNVQINASEYVNISGVNPNGLASQALLSTTSSGLYATTEATASGKGGSIQVSTGTLNISDGGVLNAQTKSASPGGNVYVDANNLKLASGGQILTNASDSGNAGDITLKVADNISLEGSGSKLLANTEINSRGSGGNILIYSPRRVLIRNGAEINTSTFGEGNAGNIVVDALDTILLENSSISSRTADQGNAGNIQLNALKSISISGMNSEDSSSGLLTSTNSSGNGGDISVNTSAFEIADGAVLDTRTTSTGAGGGVKVIANTFDAVNGGKLLTTTEGSKSAGNITLQVIDSINLEGSDSGLFANTTKESTGNGGTIFIDPRQVTIKDGAGVAVNSQGQGNAGNISLFADSITLDDQAFLSATTTSGTGGNIDVEAKNVLLRDRSRITATAGVEGAGGDGGNIRINTDLLVSSGNSEITAEAFTGQGGNITIDAQAVFLSPDSIISASSERGINGIVEINRPEADPASALVELPAEVFDISGLIARGCAVGEGNTATGVSQFVVTGRGGLPQTPAEVVRSEAALADLGTSVSDTVNSASANISSNSTNSAAASLVEAQGWVLSDKGEVVLTAQAANVTPHGSWLKSANCRGQ